MRESCVCPKCHHNRILQIAAVPDADGDNGTKNLHIAVTFAGQGWLGGDRTTTAGTLSASVCRRCGYTELYTTRPPRSRSTAATSKSSSVPSPKARIAEVQCAGSGEPLAPVGTRVVAGHRAVVGLHRDPRPPDLDPGSPVRLVSPHHRRRGARRVRAAARSFAPSAASGGRALRRRRRDRRHSLVVLLRRDQGRRHRDRGAHAVDDGVLHGVHRADRVSPPDRSRRARDRCAGRRRRRATRPDRAPSHAARARARTRLGLVRVDVRRDERQARASRAARSG